MGAPGVLAIVPERDQTSQIDDRVCRWAWIANCTRDSEDRLHLLRAGARCRARPLARGSNQERRRLGFRADQIPKDQLRATSWSRPSPASVRDARYSALTALHTLVSTRAPTRTTVRSTGVDAVGVPGTGV